MYGEDKQRVVCGKASNGGNGRMKLGGFTKKSEVKVYMLKSDQKV